MDVHAVCEFLVLGKTQDTEPLVVLSGFSKRLFCFVQVKTMCRYGCMYFLAALVLVCVDVIVVSSV